MREPTGVVLLTLSAILIGAGIAAFFSGDQRVGGALMGAGAFVFLMTAAFLLIWPNRRKSVNDTDWLSTVTAETRVQAVITVGENSDMPDKLKRLTLAEIALLRRMETRPDSQWPIIPKPRDRCEGVLTEMRVLDREEVFTRLKGADLLVSQQGMCLLTADGAKLASDFTQYLTHDPRLVAAYRKVTALTTSRLDERSRRP